MRRSRVMPTTLVAGLLLLGACGGDGQSSGAGAGPAGTFP